jgi:hypothetical protein
MNKKNLEKGMQILGIQWDQDGGGYPPEIVEVGDYIVSSGKGDYDTIRYWHKTVIETIGILQNNFSYIEDYNEVIRGILDEMDGK